MTFDEAMAVINRSPLSVVGRESAPGMRVTLRFGREVLLMLVPRFVDYTPTEGDMRATDWRMVE